MATFDSRRSPSRRRIAAGLGNNVIPFPSSPPDNDPDFVWEPPPPSPGDLQRLSTWAASLTPLERAALAKGLESVLNNSDTNEEFTTATWMSQALTVHPYFETQE